MWATSRTITEKRHTKEKMIYKVIHSKAKAIWLALHLIIIGSTILPSASHSATLGLEPRPMPNGASIDILTLRGEIKKGDLEAIAQHYIKNPNDTFHLVLQSPGGDVAEALKIAELAKKLRLHLHAGDDLGCHSACALIWINGAYRYAAPAERKIRATGKVGLHRPYFHRPTNSTQSLQRQTQVMNDLRLHLTKHQFPTHLIDKMMGRSSQDIYILTENDLAEIKTVPADLEELYIAVCNAKINNIMDSISNARSTAESQSAVAELNRVSDCTDQLDKDSRLATINRMKTGWRPTTAPLSQP